MFPFATYLTRNVPDGSKPGSLSPHDIAVWGACRLAAGMHQFCGPRRVAPLMILMYHRIAPVYRSVPKPSMNVPPRRFREQLRGLQARGVEFWPLRRALAWRGSGRPFPRNTAVVTFDDGFENNLRYALPILRELNIPATLFLNTAYLDQEAPFPMDRWGREYRDRVPAEAYRPLTRDGCAQLLDSGLFELGAHTHSHQDFRSRPAAFEQDLRQNVELLARYFGIAHPTFSFPYGKPQAGFTSRELVEAARRVGVQCGLTTESVTVDPTVQDPFCWGRFNTYDSDTPFTLAARHAGWFGWLPEQKHRLANAWNRLRTNHKGVEADPSARPASTQVLHNWRNPTADGSFD